MKLIRANVSQLLVTTKFQEFVCDYLERVNPIQDAAAQVDLLTTLRYFFPWNKWREEYLAFWCTVVWFGPIPRPQPLLAVSRIQYVYPGSLIWIFSIPGPNFFHPGRRICIKEFEYFNPKIVSKLSEISGLLVPDPDPDFLPIPDSGSRGQKGTGSRVRIRNTAC